MKKTNFFKLFLVGVAALSIGFTGCNYVNEDDFKAACERIDVLEDGIAGLQSQLDALGFVTNVTQKPGDPKTLVITFRTGNPVEITLPIPPEVPPGTYSKVEIVDGKWVIDGTNTGVLALTELPAFVTPAQIADFLTADEIAALIAAAQVDTTPFATKAELEEYLKISAVEAYGFLTMEDLMAAMAAMNIDFTQLATKADIAAAIEAALADYLTAEEINELIAAIENGDFITMDDVKEHADVTVSEDGFYVINQVKTTIPAAGVVVPFTPTINPATGMWQFEEGVDSEYPAIGAWFSVETPESIDLWIWDDENKEMAKVVLAKEGHSHEVMISKIDIFGWLTGTKDTNWTVDMTENISKAGASEAAQAYLKYLWEVASYDARVEAYNEAVAADAAWTAWKAQYDAHLAYENSVIAYHAWQQEWAAYNADMVQYEIDKDAWDLAVEAREGYEGALEAWELLKDAHDAWAAQEPKRSDYFFTIEYNLAHDAWERREPTDPGTEPAFVPEPGTEPVEPTEPASDPEMGPEVLAAVANPGYEPARVAIPAEPQEPVAKPFVQINNQFATLPVNYNWINAFYEDEDATAASNVGTKTHGAKWTGGKDEFATGEVLTTLAAEGKGILVQVHPTNASPERIKQVVLQNSKANNGLDIILGEPKLLTGTLTRAAENSGVYFIPLGVEYTHKVYATKAAYTNMYEKDALYTLVNNMGVRSEYSAFSIEPVNVRSFEAAIKDLKPAVGTEGIVVPGAYEVLVGEEYSVDFTVTATAPNEDNYTDAVIDWFMAISPVSDNNTFVPAEFGFEISNNGQTFQVNRLPDHMTKATFWIRVYKLGVDGNVYIEDIEIFPYRETPGAVIHNEDYLINDLDGEAGQKVESQNDVYDMAQMFGVLETIPAEQVSNMKLRWQHNVYGAKRWAITSATIGGVAAETEDFFENNFGVALKWYGEGNKAITTNLWEARTIALEKPLYEIDGVGTFAVNKEYEIRIEFYDKDDVAISYATIKFKPVIPALENWFAKDEYYWNDGLTVLNAYYKTPHTWAADEFYGNAQPFGATKATYYNVFSNDAVNTKHSPATPYDGGFKLFGEAPASANATQWMDDNSAVVWNSTAAHPNITFGAITGEKQTIVALANQYPAPGATVTPYGYGQLLPLTVAPGAYLGVYQYSAATGHAAWLAKLNFQMKIMSALYEGAIEAAGATVPASAATVGDVYKVREGAFKAWNYNNDGKTKNEYRLFKEANGQYAYRYIKEVQFYAPAGQLTQYNFANAAGENIDGDVTGQLTDAQGGYVGLIPLNLSQTANPIIGVRVIDRFGKVKTAELPLEFVVY